MQVFSSPVQRRGDGVILGPAMQRRRPSSTVCDACSAPIEGEPAARGLLLFPRGERVEREEPPLCERCAHAIGMTALYRFIEEEEEG